MRDDLATWCERLVTEGRVSAVAIQVIAPDAGSTVRVHAGTLWSDGPPLDERALFDLASLTKPWSATLALWLDARGELPLATRLGELWPRAGEAVAGIRLEDLLRHRAGFVRWRPLYALCDSPEEAEERLLRGEWRRDPAPAEGEEEYSDLDYLLWGLAAERATGASYEELVARLSEHLGVTGIAPTGSVAALERGAECRLGTGREVELAAAERIRVEEQPAPPRGRVQDGNGRFFGRAMAHAGLFGSIGAVATLARHWLEPRGALPAETVAAALEPPGRFALGWFRGGETAAGRLLGASGFGHDGFTGATMWLDRVQRRGVVMLAHRASLEVDLTSVRVELVRRTLAL